MHVGPSGAVESDEGKRIRGRSQGTSADRSNRRNGSCRDVDSQGLSGRFSLVGTTSVMLNSPLSASVSSTSIWKSRTCASHEVCNLAVSCITR